jgi:ribosomal protein S18 acetylase RimI-like enzyme
VSYRAEPKFGASAWRGRGGFVEILSRRDGEMYDAAARRARGRETITRSRMFSFHRHSRTCPMINCRFWEMDKPAIWDPEIDLTWQVPVEPANWRMLREARLAALLDSPQVFLSNHSRESQWGELEWQEMIEDDTWVVAHEASHVIAVARSVSEPELPFVRYIESVWVAPTHRKLGVCRALLRAIAKRERESRVGELRLWVLEHNHDAQSAYLALGFEPSGHPHFLQAVQQHEQLLKVSVDQLLEARPNRRSFTFDNHGAEVSPSPSL